MGSHVHSLTTLGYLESDTFSDVITVKAGRMLGKLSQRFLHTDEVNFALLPLIPGHQF